MAEIDIEVNVKDLLKTVDEYGKANEIALKQAARSIGGEAAGFAKENCPVDTGLLRNSITFALSGEEPDITSYKADKPKPDGTVESGEYSGAVAQEAQLAIYIGTNVKYAEYQENGDYQHKHGSKHFIKRAATEHNDRYESILKAALEAAKPN